MRKLIVPAAAIAALMLGSSAALANECGLNEKQLAAGWQCVVENAGEDESRLIGNVASGFKCQDRTVVTEVTWTAINPGNQVVDAKSGSEELDEPEVGPWGSAYDPPCNND